MLRDGQFINYDHTEVENTGSNFTARIIGENYSRVRVIADERSNRNSSSVILLLAMANPCLVVACSGAFPCALRMKGVQFSEKPWHEWQWRGTVRFKIVASGTISHRTRRMVKAGNELHEEARTKGVRERISLNVEEGQHISLPFNVDFISSVGNSYVKHLVKLRRNVATRQSTSSVLVMGTIPLREICESVEFDAEVPRGVRMINVLLVREDADALEGLTRFSQRVVRVSVAVMSKITGLDSPPEAMGVLSYPSSFTSFERHQNTAHSQLEKWCPSPRRILVLDAIQDPGNLGTLIRTAAAFGWDGLFLLPGCCDPFNEKALRAARGASFRVPIAVGNWHHIKELAASNNLKLYAGEPEPVSTSGKPDSEAGGKSILGDRKGDLTNGLGGAGISLDFGADIATKLKPIISSQEGLCLVLGSEGQGLSNNILQDCMSVSIPMPGRFESLNVAVAGGILMFLLR